MDECQKRVLKKSKEAAEYFCDERPGFIAVVFKEMLQFVDDFQEATQVRCLLLLLLFIFYLKNLKQDKGGGWETRINITIAGLGYTL